MTHYFLNKGLVKGFLKRDAKENEGFFSLTKWLKRTLNYLNVPYNDPCCDTEATTVPVRYNNEDEAIEALDPATNTWVVVTTGGGGATSAAWIMTSANMTLDPDENRILANATGGNISITLPPAATAEGIYTIKKQDSSVNTVTVVGSIDGATNFVLDAASESVSVLSNGTAYYIL